MAENVAELNDECAGPVLVNLAEAARFVGEWEASAAFSARALEVARRRADGEVERIALTLMEKAKRQEPPPPADKPGPGAPIAALARHLAARLRRWRRYGRNAGIEV